MMSQIDRRVDLPPVDWSELGVSGLLPTGMPTLLLADVEGCTRSWETPPEKMTSAIARLNQTVSEVIAAHGGVRPVKQRKSDGFVAAFAGAADAVACALELQRAPLAPIRLRIGVHTGEVQLRDQANYTGPTINRTARLRDLAHGGQTVLSGATGDIVIDRLPAGAWLTDLGTHRLRDLPRPERVVQLCHPDLRNEFPPLRTPETGATHNLPVQLTSFVGREAEMHSLRGFLAGNRLVTLTGAGGVGKTRLAVQVAAELAEQFGDGVRYVDLAPITDPGMVPVAVARALGLPDQPGLSTMDSLVRFINGRQMLLVPDNCEHLLDACAALIVALLGACPRLTLLTTSREPIGVAGEVSLRVPSLALSDEAIELFTDRARQVGPDFRVTDENAAAVGEICRRLDGLPLAIELAAARVRALSLGEILDGLHDRFRLLTGGARNAVRRQQTLRASVDWSYALLTEPERVLFRRLAVFLGGFDLDAAEAVAGADAVQRYQVLDQLTLLVDKSLVVGEYAERRTRYRLLETVRQYALEELGESGEADAVRARHRDHYAALAALLDTPGRADYEQRLEQAEIEIDNLRAALGWSREHSDVELALALASSLQPLWLAQGRIREGWAWLDTILDDGRHHVEVAPAVRARALADKALLGTWVDAAASADQAQQALAIAREVDDPALLARALTACGYSASASCNAELARPYFAEAMRFARASDDPWRLSQILAWQATAAAIAGDAIAVRAAAEEGTELADAIGNRFDSLQCRGYLAWAQLWQGDLAGAVAQFRTVAASADAAHADILKPGSLQGLGYALACQGEVNAARTAAEAALQAAGELGEYFLGFGYSVLAMAALAAGDVETAQDACETAWQQLSVFPQAAAVQRAYNAQAALATGDLTAARRWADGTASAAAGWHRAEALTACARVAIAQRDPALAERDAHDALACAADSGAYVAVPDLLECLAGLAADAGSQREAARLFGSAEAIRNRMGLVRFKIYDSAYESWAATVRNALERDELDRAWDEGATLSIDETIAYALRGHTGRKRPASGWTSLTPTERDVTRLVAEGLTNNDIAARLFVSPRTVQTHLAHVYTKLGLHSRVQLVREAARHA